MKNPEYGGNCAFATSIGKKGVKGNPQYSLKIGSKRYIFLNPVAKLLFRILPGRKSKADKNWKLQRKIRP